MKNDNHDYFGRLNPQRRFHASQAQIEASAKAREIGIKALNKRASLMAQRSEKSVLTYMKNHHQVTSKQIANFYGWNNDWLRKHVMPRLIKKLLVERVIIMSDSGWPMRYEYKLHEN